MASKHRLRDATPEQLERGLKSAAANGAVPPDVRRNILSRLSALRRYLERVVCSEPWFRNCWNAGESYPPAADTTPMLPCRCARCRRAGRLWPAHYCRSATSRRGDAIVSYECHLESL